MGNAGRPASRGRQKPRCGPAFARLRLFADRRETAPPSVGVGANATRRAIFEYGEEHGYALGARDLTGTILVSSDGCVGRAAHSRTAMTHQGDRPRHAVHEPRWV